jgi:hypothetical protein
MAPRYLSCPGCHIRVRRSAPEIDLLEGMCPICGAGLRSASSTSGVMGFRLFDLGPLSDGWPSGAPRAVGRPAGFMAHRGAAVAGDDLDGQRWLNEGGSFPGEAVAKCPAPR